MKTCAKCNTPKHIDEFGKDKKAKDGKRSYCKVCYREYMAEYFTKNKSAAALRVARSKINAKQIESYEKYVDCKCPLCEKMHEVMMEWTGRGIPRIFCRSCKSVGSGRKMQVSANYYEIGRI